MSIIRVNSLRRNPFYIIFYVNVAALVILGIVPLALLVYYNYNIYKELKSPPNVFQDNETTAIRCSQEKDLARVLIGIVIIFICCHVLRIFLNFYEMVVIKNAMRCYSPGKPIFARWFMILDQFNYLMTVINSSVNLIVYCCLNTSFRRGVLSCKQYFVQRLPLAECGRQYRMCYKH